MNTETRVLGRRLDVHHDPVTTGVIAVCAICAVSTDDGFVSGLRHNVQPAEVVRAQSYLAAFDMTDPPAS